MTDTTLQTRTIVGMEIHVQLATRTKMFCGCPLKFGVTPNSCVCAVCLGHPGSLPVINRQAFEFSVLTGMALNCSIARFTKWDRKSYFYPDLPKDYQISQYDLPVAENGYLDIPVGIKPNADNQAIAEGRTHQSLAPLGRGQGEGLPPPGMKRIRIRRLHLEEDAGKNLHDVPGCTLVDLNRAGTPLMEIVTEPDIASAEEAYIFATELQRLVVYLGVSEGVMQKAQMRFEPNVNVVIEADGQEFRTPIAEIKNLNSFRSVRNSIEYEVERHIAAWQADRDYVKGKRPNENRGWNDDRGTTEFQREKEAAHDYRYFPDPDLVPVHVTEEMLTGFKSSLPELPIERRTRFIERFSLSAKDAETITDHRPTADLFEQVIAAGGPAEIVGKQFVNAWLSLANDRGVRVTELPVDAARMAELATITAAGTINKTAANQIAQVMVDRPESPSKLAEELGLIQIQDRGATEAWVAQAFAENEQAVKDAIANPKKAKAATGFLRGQVMKISGGKADPKLVGELIEKKLADLSKS